MGGGNILLSIFYSDRAGACESSCFFCFRSLSLVSVAILSSFYVNDS